MNRDRKLPTEFLERVLTRYSRPLPEQVAAATDRVWQRLKVEPVVEAHHTVMNSRTAHPSLGWRWPAIAAAVAIMFLAFFLWQSRTAGTAETPLYRLAGAETLAVQPGETIRMSHVLRSGEESSGAFVLKDGTHVEMRSQSELSIQTADDGVRLQLNKGSFIVHAAKQGDRHLYVRTHNVTLRGEDSVFIVDVEETGLRVTVIRGDVLLQPGATSKKLSAGEQFSTNVLMDARTLSEEIAWSRNVAELMQQALVVARPHGGFETQTSPGTEAQAFDVTSIKLTPRENAGTVQPSITTFPPGGGFRKTNTTLKMLVQLAYGLQEYQVMGGSEWVNSERFDVEARSAKNAGRDEVLKMIQVMLADRFQLNVRRETKQSSIFALAVLKNGPKLSAATESSPADVRIGRYSGNRSMAQLAQYLGSVVDRPVVDRTGLSGVFEIHLEFAPDYSSRVNPNIPTVFKALEEQLGLRLESARGPVETLTIERAVHPTEN